MYPLLEQPVRPLLTLFQSAHIFHRWTASTPPECVTGPVSIKRIRRESVKLPSRRLDVQSRTIPVIIGTIGIPNHCGTANYALSGSA